MKSITGKYFLLYFLSLCCISTVGAQTAFILSDRTVESGSFFTTDLKVAAFQDIVGAQFTIKWDPTMLHYVGLSNFNLDITLESDFGTNKVNEGKLTFVWDDDDLSGESLPDSAVLFSIEFEAIGLPDTTPVFFSDELPTVLEITDVNGNTVNANFVDGTVEIIMTTGATYVSAPEEVTVESCYPNPFNQGTQLRLSLHQSTPVTVLITNTEGKTIYQEQRTLNAGLQTLQFDKSKFPNTGTYYVQLRSDKFLVVQRLIFLAK